MAMRRDSNRPGERGLSLIEALAIVTITALLALLLLPMVSRAAGRNFLLTDRALDGAQATIAEAEFRALLRATQSDAEGALMLGARVDGVAFSPSLAEDMACARAGAPRPVRFLIVREGRLVCESEGRRRDVLRWGDGEARFSYSADGLAWSAQWSQDTAPAMVRFELERPGFPPLTWTERAGWTGPPRADVPP